MANKKRKLFQFLEIGRYTYTYNHIHSQIIYTHTHTHICCVHKKNKIKKKEEKKICRIFTKRKKKYNIARINFVRFISALQYEYLQINNNFSEKKKIFVFSFKYAECRATFCL